VTSGVQPTCNISCDRQLAIFGRELALQAALRNLLAWAAVVTVPCYLGASGGAGDLMDRTSWIVWAILVVEVTALGFIGYWFSLRTLRLFTGVTAFILAIAVTRFGFVHLDPGYKSNLVNSFLSGVDQVVKALLQPFWPGKPPAPGVAGRWIIAFALLFGYRQLEGWAQRWQAPELDLSEIGRGRPTTAPAVPSAAADGHGTAATAAGPTAGQRHAQLAAELRFRLPTMQVRTPSILPGGTRANALASIAEKSGVDGASMVGAVLRFAGMLWPSPRLVRVRSWVESAKGCQITVLLEDVKTGQPIATNTVAGENFNEAASMVAGYIARQIFSMDRTVPPSCYGTADGRDLGAMQLARLQRAYAACPGDIADSRDRQIDILRSFTGTDRTAGIVRYELAQLLAFVPPQRQDLECLRLHALNRELHHRFYRGRYRFAMTLEMLANPEHHFQDNKETRDNLKEILEILFRCGLTDKDENQTDEDRWDPVPSPCSCEASCMQVSKELALELLKIAAKDLREVRTQLNAWRVVRDALLRRDERAVWLPHLKRRYRQAFRDGVCVAELLVAIRCRLRDPAGKDSRWLKRVRFRWHLRRAIRITSFIAGNPALIKKVLKNDPPSKWWAASASKGRRWHLRRATGNPAPIEEVRTDPGQSAASASKGALGPLPWARTRDRVRRLPWQRSTASWQAAYNTACLYAALADAALADAAPAKRAAGRTQEVSVKDLERRVIVSLRRAVNNPRSELERSSDWIDSDPDFSGMCRNSPDFTDFKKFRLDQKRQDYPDSFSARKCPVPQTPPDKIPAVPLMHLILALDLDPTPRAEAPLDQ
jgi:hypothetical protein